MEEIARVTELDLRWLATECHERGVPMVAITYAAAGSWFLGANEGIERASTGSFPIVRGSDALARFAERYGLLTLAPPLFDKSVHPTQILYDEIGAMVLETLDREHLLPPP